MFDDESPDDETGIFKTKKIKLPLRKNWQGREDADMLLEKQSGWKCNHDGSDGFDDPTGQNDD